MTQHDQHTHAVREMLVENVASASRGSHPQPRGAGALLAATLVGALVGGGVTAAVAVGFAGPGGAENVEYVTSDDASIIKTQSAAFSLIGTHTPLVAEPIVETHAGSATITLPPRPEGANRIALSVRCTSYGTVDVLVDGEFQAGTRCLEEPQITQGSGLSTLLEPPMSGDLQFEASAGTLYALWVGWVIAPEAPQPSEALLAEIADGAATEDEYRAAFGRFKACMEASGHLLGETWVGTGYLYTTTDAAHQDGSDMRCYQEVDRLWQAQREAEESGE